MLCFFPGFKAAWNQTAALKSFLGGESVSALLYSCFLQLFGIFLFLPHHTTKLMVPILPCNKSKVDPAILPKRGGRIKKTKQCQTLPGMLAAIWNPIGLKRSISCPCQSSWNLWSQCMMLPGCLILKKLNMKIQATEHDRFGYGSKDCQTLWFTLSSAHRNIDLFGAFWARSLTSPSSNEQRNKSAAVMSPLCLLDNDWCTCARDGDDKQ